MGLKVLSSESSSLFLRQFEPISYLQHLEDLDDAWKTEHKYCQRANDVAFKQSYISLERTPKSNR